MIGQSFLAMTVIDLAIIGCALALFYLYHKYRLLISRLGLQNGFRLVLSGIAIMSLIYLLDLFSMTVMPMIVGMEQAMAFMNQLHLHHKWIVMLVSVGLVTVGLNLLFRTFLPRLNEKINSAAQALTDIEKRFQILYNETPAIFITVDRHGTVLNTNQYGAEHLGYLPDRLIGSELRKFVAEEDVDVQTRFIEQGFENDKALSQIEVRFITAARSSLWIRQTSKLLTETGSPDKLLLACQDISESRKMSDMLSYQASHDELTGLFNRRAIQQHLQNLLDTSIEGANHAFLYLDIDQLKVVNDTCGHEAGDGLIRQLAAVIQKTIRKGDFLGRIGGDEFGIVLDHCPIKEAASIAEKVRKEVEGFTYVWKNHSFRQSVSIGLTDTSFTVEVGDVIGAADAACYEAKDSGRNRVKIHAHQAAGSITTRQDMHWVPRLQNGLIHHRFALYFQPLLSLTTHLSSYVHYEMLLRFMDDDDQLIPPGVFLPAAERFNLSDQIDLWVVKNSLEFLENNSMHMSELDCCAINLSGTSLVSMRVRDSILGLVRESTVAPSKICFEITETAAISNLNEAQEFVDKLKSVGVRFALDDFGSGVSSFGYLKNLPVDYIKIDGIFVRDIVEDRVSRALVSAINNIGHELGLVTVAEYVENESIVNILREQGIDLAQGYHIARPMPVSELMNYYSPDTDQRQSG